MRRMLLSAMGMMVLAQLAAGAALGVETPEAKVPDFTYQLKGPRLKLIPPPGHHFNIKAPSVVSFSDKDLALKLNERAISAVLPAPHPPGRVSASAYVCDQARTYCVKKSLAIDVPALGAGNADGDETRARPESRPSPKRHVTRKGKDERTGFILNDPKRAFRLARETKRPLLIDFFGIWCPPCNRLDETIFRTARFRERVASRVVLLALDSDEPGSAELKSKYRVQGLPTLLLTTSQGDEITRLIGFHPLEEIEQAAMTAAARKPEGYEALAAKASGGNAEARYRAAQIALDRGEPEKAREWVEPLKAAFKAAGDPRIQLVYDSELQAALAREDRAKARAALDDWLAVSPRASVDRLENLQKLADLAEEAGDAKGSRQAVSSAIEVARELRAPEGLKLLKGTEYSIADLDETLGELYSRLGDEARARDSYNRCDADYAAEAREAKTGFARGAALERSYCLSQAGKIDESEALLNQAVRRYPAEFTFHLQLAKLLLQQRHDAAKSLSEADEALRYAYGGQRLKAVLAKAQALNVLDRPVPGIRAIDEELAYPISGTPSPGTLLLRKKLEDLRTELSKRLATSEGARR